MLVSGENTLEVHADGCDGALVGLVKLKSNETGVVAQGNDQAAAGRL